MRTLVADNKRSPEYWLPFLQKVKDKLKSDPTMLEVCKKYQTDPEELDLVPIKFADIDVSARTDRGVITLNYELLNLDDTTMLQSYLVHEINHYLSQEQRPTQSADDGDYLSNKDEQEAFQKQIRFIDDHEGEERAEEYADQVLDHHDESGEERRKKKDILMKCVNSFEMLATNIKVGS